MQGFYGNRRGMPHQRLLTQGPLTYGDPVGQGTYYGDPYGSAAAAAAAGWVFRGGRWVFVGTKAALAAGGTAAAGAAGSIAAGGGVLAAAGAAAAPITLAAGIAGAGARAGAGLFRLIAPRWASKRLSKRTSRLKRKLRKDGVVAKILSPFRKARLNRLTRTKARVDKRLLKRYYKDQRVVAPQLAQKRAEQKRKVRRLKKKLQSQRQRFAAAVAAAGGGSGFAPTLPPMPEAPPLYEDEPDMAALRDAAGQGYDPSAAAMEDAGAAGAVAPGGGGLPWGWIIGGTVVLGLLYAFSRRGKGGGASSSSGGGSGLSAEEKAARREERRAAIVAKREARRARKAARRASSSSRSAPRASSYSAPAYSSSYGGGYGGGGYR